MFSSDIVNECRVYLGFKLPIEIIPTRIDNFMSKLSIVDLVETYYRLCDFMLLPC